MNSVPPKISRTNNWFAGVTLGATALGIATMVFFFNPATHRFYPVCTFHKLTGLNCPGCGMTRALYALLHGDFSAALHDNSLFVCGLAVLAVRSAWVAVKKFHGRTDARFFPVKFLWPLLFVTFVFAVLRNLPVFSFLSPN